MANLNTNTEVRDEGNWDYTGWGTRITSSAAMDTFVTKFIDRANGILRMRVGTAWYAANVAVDPYDDILKAAEMDLAQYFLLIAAAQVTETGSDTNPSPFLGGATAIRAAAQLRLNSFKDRVAETRGTARPAGNIPIIRTSKTTDSLQGRFDPEDGSDDP